MGLPPAPVPAAASPPGCCLLPLFLPFPQDFVKKHPGGRVINFYSGKDATDAFQEFHNRSKSADKWLKSIPSRPDDGTLAAQDKDAALTEDFHKLRQDLEDEGYFKTSPAHVVYRIAEVVAMHIVGLYMIANGWGVSGCVLLGLAQGRCGWLMHEGGHHSLTGNINIDIALQVIIYGTGCGMSAAFWRNQHNKHHATPQKIGQDVDLDTLPLMLFNTEVQNGKQKSMVNAYTKPWIRMQAFLFAPVICFIVGAGWQFYVHPNHSLRTKRYHELAAMAVRYAFVYYLTTLPGWSTTNIILGYFFIYGWVSAMYIFMNFAVSHTHLPVLKQDEDVSWVRYSADHTMNVTPGPFGVVNWWMSFLNFQIEHHLFPTMPQFNHPKISPRVQALFKKHGVEYIQMSYAEAMKVTFMNLHNVGADVFYG